MDINKIFISRIKQINAFFSNKTSFNFIYVSPSSFIDSSPFFFLMKVKEESIFLENNPYCQICSPQLWILNPVPGMD